MEWRKCYLDLVLIPLSLCFSLGYHLWLWHRVRVQPHGTIIGINSAGRRRWVLAMMKDNEKKSILAVQSIRNSIMGVTVMATTSILLSCGLAAVLSSTYSIKKPLGDSVYGAHGEFMMSLKYVAVLFFFLAAFLCYSLSMRFLSQANLLINVPADLSSVGGGIHPDHVSCLLERGFALNTVGNRVFYTGLPLLLWIFGPVMVAPCSATMVSVLYNLDVVVYGEGRKGNAVVEEKEMMGCP